MNSLWKAKKIVRYIVLDLLMLGALLLVFAYFHHVRVEEIVPQKIESSAAAEATPAPTPAPTEEPNAFFDTNGLLQGKYAEKFTKETVMDVDSYTSKDISIQISERNDFECRVHVADIYVNNIDCFRTGVFDEFGSRYIDTESMANEAGAILALSGDFFYGHRQNGVFAIRNGLDYGSNPNKKQDVCILYRDGTMEVLEGGTYTLEEVYEKDPWHVWYFGPGLLDEEGKAYTKIKSSVSKTNPRSSIGYYEPGHYCFVMVEGRLEDSPGVTLVELAQIFEDLGCKVAYNLDGGQTADMVFDGESICQVRGEARDVSDILYIKEVEDAA